MKNSWIFYLAASLFILIGNVAKATAIDEAVDQEDDTVYTVVDTMPQFPGGDQEMLKFISRNVRYPAEAIEKGIKGRVVCTFIVEKDGSISSVEVARGVDELLDNEAIRVLKEMPKWKPAEHKGKIVRVSYTMPVVFSM